MSISLGKSKYFMLVTDRASNYRYVFFLKSKDEASRFLKLLYNRILTALNVKVKMLRCDRGTEFINKNLEQFFEEKGVVIGTSASRCAEQNGRIERANRTIIESARTMLCENNFPKNLWGEAVNTAVYALNRVLSTNNRQMTPHEKWHGFKPDISHMRPFGSLCVVHIPKVLRSKFGEVSAKVYLVGYEEPSDNYRVYDPVNQSVIVARDVRFIFAPSFERSSRISTCYSELFFENENNSENKIDSEKEAISENEQNNIHSDLSGENSS